MKKILPVVFLLIAGWFVGYLHHYESTKDIATTRHEAKVLRNVAEADMRRYAGLVMYQEDIILARSSEMADLVLLQGVKNFEFHQLCKKIRRARPVTTKPKRTRG